MPDIVSHYRSFAATKGKAGGFRDGRGVPARARALGAGTRGPRFPPQTPTLLPSLCSVEIPVRGRARSSVPVAAAGAVRQDGKNQRRLGSLGFPMHAFLPADHPFLSKHGSRIGGVLSCFDRVIFRGYLPICHPRGLAGWMHQRGVRPGDFRTFAPGLAERLVAHAKARAAAAGRPYQHHAKREAKEELARAIAARDGIAEGLVCVFSCLETCRTFRLKYAPGRPQLQADLRRCTVLYYFLMDRECGLIHVKLHTWLPLTCQVYVNGHAWLERQLAKRGLGYATADNAFVRLEDPAAAQLSPAEF